MKRITVVFSGLLLILTGCKAMGDGSAATSAGASVDAGVIEFSFTPPEGMDCEEVYLVGDFNGWNPGDPNLFMEEDGGVFYLEYELDPGSYLFKFYIDGEWVSSMKEYEGSFSPAVNDYSDDSYGGFNAILVVE